MTEPSHEAIPRPSAPFAHAGRTAPPVTPGRESRVDRRSRARWACQIAKTAAGAVLAVPMEEIERSERRAASVAGARQVAMYLAHVAFQISVPAMAPFFGRDRTTISHGISRVEERRDDPVFDALMERLEALCAAIRSAGEAGDPRGQGVDG